MTFFLDILVAFGVVKHHSDNLVILVDISDDERERIFRKLSRFRMALFDCNLGRDEKIASIRLTMELICNRVKARILASMMFPVMFESLIARL